MAWSEILLRIRGKLADPTDTYWTDQDIERWYNTGVQLQHRKVFSKSKFMGPEFRTYENEYLKHFIKRQLAYLQVGVQDYELPSDFWRIARVTVEGSPPYEADPVHFNEDWDVRRLPHRGPQYTRPKYGLIPSTVAGAYRIRFYVSPGDDTIPNRVAPYEIYYYRQPIPVDQLASPPVDIDLEDPFHDAPINWACYEAMTKKRIDGTVFYNKFQEIVDSIIEGPSPELPANPGENKG